jgi:hypothetical protein
MKIIFIGDIVGRPGREAVGKFLPDLKNEIKPDLVIANGENICHGRGMSENTLNDAMNAGVDFFTSGNHIFAQKKILPKLEDKSFPAIRPANFPPGNPGRGFHIYETAKMQKVLIVNLIGRVFMRQDYDCPFREMDKILQENKNDPIDAVIVDIHAEATSEKIALGHYLDGRVSAVIGSHTHVPTTDSKILSGGTAYISDVGMAGVTDSVIGVKKEPIIKGFLTQMPFKYEMADGESVFSAVLIEINDKTKKAGKIEQIIKYT